MKREKIAVCPGSFDPITHGHLDIVRRGLCVFDKVIIAVGHNPLKQDLFTTEEKIEMITRSVEENPRIEVDSFEGLVPQPALEKLLEKFPHKNDKQHP